MAGERQGPFDRILKPRDGGAADGGAPDRAVMYVGGTILGLALLLLILVLPPISILSRGDGDGGIPSTPGDASTYTSNVRSGMPKLPAGLVAASAHFDLAAPADQRGASAVTVPLKEKQTDVHSLGMYSYIDGKWERLADVTLAAGGAAARADVDALPGNVAVLRRSKATLQVAGIIGAGAQVDPRAENAITVLHPLAFLPADNGEVVGVRPAVPPAGYRVVPGVVAPNAEVVDNILRSTDIRNSHANALAQTVIQGNYAGINIDYPAVNPALKEEYSAFVETLANALHEYGHTLTLTLPMPRSQDGAIDTGAYDWERLGTLADSLIMGGEMDQELYFQNMQPALDYAVANVDRSKLSLTITSQAIERGGDGLRTLPLADAFSLASAVGIASEGEITAGTPVQLVAQNLAVSEGASGMHWDDVARAVTFSYPGRGGKRTVWLPNAFSAAFRLELAQRYDLGGVAVTSAAENEGDVWSAVRQLSDTGDITLSKPNGDLLAPSWSAANGSISPSSGDTTTWTAPAEPGTYDVTLIISDGVARAGQRISIDVGAAPPPP